ncbi:hypothetical protein KUTeg_023598 [Tegillarca granosa]|uniref:Uncharacterized protein n=1 Tax=Tegillarca granosa TaxID=220873 RepID=A0ABQ9E274_TEGGR|nr:hypothetical protein KUTeg_023598 [Tegillarca granosa]
MATPTPNISESISNAHLTLYSDMAQASQMPIAEPAVEHTSLSHVQTVPMHQMHPQHFDMNFFMNDIIRRLNTIDCKVSKLDLIESGLKTVTERVGQVERSLDTVTSNQIELDKIVRISDDYNKEMSSKIGLCENEMKGLKKQVQEEYSLLRQARAWNNKAVLIKDKLYINNKLYVFPELKEDGNGEIANIEDRWTISFVPDNRTRREDRFRETRTYKRRKINSTESTTGGDMDIAHQDKEEEDKEEEVQLETENNE